MYARHRLDISVGQLLFALGASLVERDEAGIAERIEKAWSGEGDALVCLSVRSGFDLLLQALALPPGSEILVSAVTIPDMVRVIEGHGLRAIPVDLDLDTLAPSLQLLERAVSERSRAILVAHLFGGLVDLAPIAGFARRHDLLLLEDAAQGFVGPASTGDPAADISMFSFGPIKTST
ncbi:MAG: DegT/DnrJ/EryC1/StrS family aminotransferase, partial [Candidatus Methylomirabilales bacterium]